jgi:aspartyl-tRNA(Asn)/glutamyl-tRNA(Gln) amidotransferase subunit C
MFAAKWLRFSRKYGPNPGRCGKGGIIPYRAARPPCPARKSAREFPPFLALLSMSLTRSDIGRIAHLARLELDESKSERMLTKLNDFFGIVEAMRAVDTSGVEPLAHPVAIVRDVALRLRDDVVTEPDQRQANQRSAPAVEDGLFLVPRVIE